MLQKVWHDFEVLADALKSSPGAPEYLDSQQFKIKAVHWVNAFRIATFDEVSTCNKLIENDMNI